MTISKELKLNLKRSAHSLKPVVIIGNHGLTPAVELELERALEDHELIKVRVNALDRDERRAIILTLCEHTRATLIQTIGHIAVIYRLSAKKAQKAKKKP